MTEKKEIVKLESATIRLITATQIATSVSDIVKELVENALDAGSTVIRVKLENFGIDKIEISDNGSGISKEDLKVCALPHYTSKIRQHQDLESLTTYGFRGEALAAICSVSKLKITTKTEHDLVAATCDYDHHGNLVDSKPSANAQGTLIVASQLFYNVPVRKQYYSTAKTKKDELSKVEDLLLNFGLIHPQLHLSLHHNRSPVWQKSRAADFIANIHQVLGHSICSQMEFIKKNSNTLPFLMIPKSTASVESCFRSKPDRCFTIVNDRPVHCKTIEKVMKELYEPVSGKSTLYPMFIVSLRFAGKEVDVNLKPNKSEVLMEREAEVVELIKTQVIQILKINFGSTIQPVKDAKVVETERVSEDEKTVIPETPKVAVSVETEKHSSTDQLDIIDDEDLFNGFCEPFTEQDVSKNIVNSAPPLPPTPQPFDGGSEKIVSIGSEEWRKGIAKDSSGRIVHPVEILRGGDHFAKRISEETPNSASKKPRLAETEDALKIVGSYPRQLETVNGKVRRVPSDPFENYCKAMTTEFLSQNPTATFNDLSQQLNQSWRNLSPSDRQQYEKKSDQQQKLRVGPSKYSRTTPTSGGNSLDRFLCPQTPVVRATNSSLTEASHLKSVVVCVDFSMDMLQAYQREPSRVLKNVGRWTCVGKVEGHGWICAHGDGLYAVNFQRLYEMILYSRMLNQHYLPSVSRSDPLVLTERSLGNSRLWDLLINLSAQGETPSSRVIDDPRVTANGLGIRLCEDSTGSILSAQVFRAPAAIEKFGLPDVQQILKQISYPNSSTESCRPVCAQQLLKFEAAQLAADRLTDPDDREICELLEQWSEFEDGNCLHGEPVVLKLKDLH